jgi:hypothetical protein
MDEGVMPKKFSLEAQQELLAKVQHSLTSAKSSGDQDAIDKAALTSVIEVVRKHRDMQVDNRSALLQAFKDAGFEPKKAASTDVKAADTAHKYAEVMVGDFLQDIKDVQLTVHVTSDKFAKERLDSVLSTYENKPHVSMGQSSFPSHYTTSAGGASTFLGRSSGRS